MILGNYAYAIDVFPLRIEGRAWLFSRNSSPRGSEPNLYTVQRDAVGAMMRFVQ